MEIKQELIENEIQIGVKLRHIELLQKWFDNYFQPQLIQSMWQTDFKISQDKYFKDENGNCLEYNSIEQLKEQGEKVREQIKNLRIEIEQLKNL